MPVFLAAGAVTVPFGFMQFEGLQAIEQVPRSAERQTQTGMDEGPTRKAGFSVRRAPDAALGPARIAEGNPERVVGLYETFIAACYEKATRE